MWCVTDELLDSLRCIVCSSHVRCPPVYGGPDGLLCYACGALVDNQATRQVGYEILLPHLKFPCRYGCGTRATYKELDTHEERCKRFYDDESLPSTPCTPYTPISEHRFFSKQDAAQDLMVELSCSSKGNRTTRKLTVLKYNMNVYNSEGSTRLCLVNGSSRRNAYPADSVRAIEMSIEGAFSLKGTSPQSIYCNVKTVEIEDEVSVAQETEICTNCRSMAKRDSCSYGHTMCRACLLMGCKKCRKSSLVKCGYPGCTWCDSYLNLPRHQANCPSAPLHCPFPECHWKSPELLLKSHLAESHPSFRGSALDKAFSSVDNFWIMLAFSRIFLCKYFVYDEQTEILVELYANTSNNGNFTYTIELFKGGDPIKKFEQTCGILNQSIYHPGITLPNKTVKESTLFIITIS